jgi:hypothetical protein
MGRVAGQLASHDSWPAGGQAGALSRCEEVACPPVPLVSYLPFLQGGVPQSARASEERQDMSLEKVLSWLLRSALSLSRGSSMKVKVKCQNPECPHPDQPVEWVGGRMRKYCSPTCRKYAHRLRKAEEEQRRQQQLLARLRACWRRYHPCAAEQLEALYEQYGLEAAQLATQAFEVQLGARPEAKRNYA